MRIRNIKSKRSYTKEDALNTIERNIKWINSADNKSSILLGVYSFLFGGSFFILDSTIIKEYTNNGKYLLVLIYGFILLTLAISMIITPIFLILVINSRTKVTMYKPNKNIIYFEDISKKKYDEFKEMVNKIRENEVIDDLISQVYITSKIASKKYRMLKYGYLWFLILLFSIILYLLLIQIIK